MLVYYFGTKENLLAEALATQHPNPTEMFLGVHDGDSLRTGLLTWWTTMRGDNDTARSTRLMLQAMSRAVGGDCPFTKYATRLITEGVADVSAAIVRTGVPEQRAADLATGAISGLRGILMDYAITGDARRTDLAARRLIELIVNDACPERAEVTA